MSLLCSKIGSSLIQNCLSPSPLLKLGGFAVNKHFQTSAALGSYGLGLRVGSYLNCVDDSELGRQAKIAGKPPKIIGVVGHHTRRGRYKYAELGDKVVLAVKGEKKRGYIVGMKLPQQPLIPRFDSNNVVLVEKNGTPLGKRVLAPIPSCLRKKAEGDFSKIIAMATKFY